MRIAEKVTKFIARILEREMVTKLLRYAVGFTSVLLGLAGCLVAIWIWWSYEYPDANPFTPFAILSPGMLGQVMNWLLVCLVAGLGFGFIGFGVSFLPSSEAEADSPSEAGK